MIVGIGNLNNTVFSHVYFLDCNNYQYGFDFEMENAVYINNCLFNDIGVIKEKVYYVTMDNNCFLNFWSLILSSISNSLFIVSNKIDLVTGFIDGLPHGGIFESLYNVYIILDTMIMQGFSYYQYLQCDYE